MTKQQKTAEHSKDDLIYALLQHVPFDGWSDEVIAAAAADCGVDAAEVARLLPGGAIDAVDAFADLADREMAKALDQLPERPERVSAIIREAILCRLDWATPHREAVASGLKILAHPRHGPRAAKILYRTVDRIWRMAGDRALDLSFYTKRATLAGVFSAVLLYWVANPTADRAKIESFLDQRLKEVAIIPKITAPARKAAKMGVKMAGRVLGRMPMRRSS